MMDNLNSKSVISMDAADRLRRNPNNHYCSSIHCSYYSCYQKLLFILYKTLSYTKKQYDEEYTTYRKNPANERSGIHEFTIALFYQKILTLSTPDATNDARVFKDKIMSLKKLRRDSDYEAVWITKEICDKAFDIADEVQKKLKKHFKL